MKQIFTTALAAWLSCSLAAGAVEELPALPVPPQDAPGGAAFANENIVHDDGTGAQISFFLPTHDKQGSLEVEYASYNIIVVKNGRFLLLEDLSGSKTEDGKAFFGKIIIPSEFIDSAEIGMFGSPRSASVGIGERLKVSTFKKILREKCWTEQKSATEGGAIRLEPNRDAATAISRIRAVIKADLTFDKLSEILGEPDMDIGSGIHIFVYRLSDGTGITVGTPDKKKVMYIEHAGKRLFPVEPPAPPLPAASTQPADVLKELERVEEQQARSLFVQHLKAKNLASDDFAFNLKPFGKSTWIIDCNTKGMSPALPWRLVMNSKGEVKELTMDSMNVVFLNEYPSSPEPKDREQLIQDFVRLHAGQAVAIIAKTTDIPGHAKAPLDADLAAAVRAPFSFGNLTTVVYTYQEIGGIVCRYRFTFENSKTFKKAECAIVGRDIGDAHYYE